MDLPINVDVECADGVCGHSTFIIFNPISGQVTHLVVRAKDFPNTQHLVGIDKITHSDAKRIQLACTRQELAQMETFIDTDFISPDIYDDIDGAPYLMWPYSTATFANMVLENEHIPAGELAIRRGANIYARDGYVGKLDEFLVDPTNEHITHLIMREGHLWGKKDVTISLSEIEHIDEDEVYLKLNKEAIEKLPAIPLRKREHNQPDLNAEMKTST